MTQGRAILLLAIGAGLLGLAHLALTALLYPKWTTGALWFVGTGLAIVIGAMANIAAMTAADRTSRSILAVINAMMTGFFAAAWSVLPGPQVIVGGILFAGLALCTFRSAIPSVSHGEKQ
jgi:hypothetical protein